MKAQDQELQSWLRDVRRDLHQHPELSLQEARTTAKIISLLSGLGVAAAGFEDMTGAVGLIEGGGPGPTLALRADIDALPISEENQLPFRSTRQGVMHACGHDLHTSILLGVARQVMQGGLYRKWRGNLKLLFQPAEETGQGARMMIERGVLESPKVDRILACHVGGSPLGQVGVYHGQSHSSNDVFRLTVKGKGAHAGRPQQSRDPIVAAAHLIAALQSIVARNVKPGEAAVITVGTVEAGSASNVIPQSAEITGCVRALSPATQELLHRRLQEVVTSVCQAFGTQAQLEIEKIFPPCINDPVVAGFLEEAALSVVGPDKVVHPPPVSGAEDFALFLQKVPGAIFRLGASGPDRAAVLHSPHFEVDEKVLPLGVGLFMEVIRRYLSPASKGRSAPLRHPRRDE